MSTSLNKVLLIGHLGDEVKIHYYDDKSCVARFSVATNEKFISKKSNQVVEHTEWHTIVVRNKIAENCEKYLSKGDQVFVEGKIKTRSWVSDSGEPQKSYEIHAYEVNFLHSKKTKEPPINNEEPNDKHGLPF